MLIRHALRPLWLKNLVASVFFGSQRVPAGEQLVADVKKSYTSEI